MAFSVAGLITTGAGSASAAIIIDLGRQSGTNSAFVGCQGWVHACNDGTHTYARAEFSLPVTTRGLPCVGWLERRTSSGAPWTTISAYHYSPDTTTGWYLDDAPYNARVCVGDLKYSDSYSCIGYW